MNYLFVIWESSYMSRSPLTLFRFCFKEAYVEKQSIHAHKGKVKDGQIKGNQQSSGKLGSLINLEIWLNLKSCKCLVRGGMIVG